MRPLSLLALAANSFFAGADTIGCAMSCRDHRFGMAVIFAVFAVYCGFVATLLISIELKEYHEQR